MKTCKAILMLWSIFILPSAVLADENNNADVPKKTNETPNTNKSPLFEGIVQQSHDISCGTAALATLIRGIVENSHLTEQDLINHIDNKKPNDHGYSMDQIQGAAAKLGYKVGLRKISKDKLHKLKQPVVLTIGLNSEFPHYVVLKGIRDNMAYFADPIRGNIRVPYDKLVNEGINDKFSAWYIMVVNPSRNKPASTNLYLSENVREILNAHITAEQSDAITLLTLPKEGQYFYGYSFNAGYGKNRSKNLKTTEEIYSHRINFSYGLTPETEIGASVEYADINQKYELDKFHASDNSNDERISVFVNRRFDLDEEGLNKIIAGLSTSYSIKDNIFGGELSVTGYRNTTFAQFFAGVSIGKDFSTKNLIDNSLPELTYSGFIGANKPFAERFQGTLIFSVNDGQSKLDSDDYKQSFSTKGGISYVLNKHVQLSPWISYSFGDGNNINFGLDVNIIGRW